MRHVRGWTLVVGGGALLAAVLAFGISLGLALSGGGDSFTGAPAASSDALAPAPAGDPVEATTPFGRDLPVSPAATVLQPEVLRLAVTSAPFEESRMAPSSRYRLPEDAPPPAPPRVERPPVPEFRLLGSVAGAEGGLAVIQVGDETPRIVATGETVSGYTLASVRPDRAVMASADQMVQVPLAQPTTSVARASENGRNARNNNANNNRNNNASNAATERAAQAAAAARGINLPAGIGQAFSALVGGNGDAAGRIEALVRQFQGAGGGTINLQGDQIIMSRPGETIRLQGGAGGQAVEVIRGRAAGGGQ